MEFANQILSASTLAGDRVRNSTGDDLGKVEDFMLDFGSGRIVYAVLSFGGIMGIGDKLFAVPPDALTIDKENHCFVMDVDKTKLEGAPGFPKNNWPDFADQSLGSRIYAYYGSQPYWN